MVPTDRYYVPLAYPDYAVCDNGTVWRVTTKHRQRKLLAPEQWKPVGRFMTQPGGAPMVALFNTDASGKRVAKVWQVKRLVALCFVPNPRGYTRVRRIKPELGDVASNLEWCRGNYKIYRLEDNHVDGQPAGCKGSDSAAV
jgi:hypothetical protein